jgi:hypothetical protein
MDILEEIYLIGLITEIVLLDVLRILIVQVDFLVMKVVFVEAMLIVLDVMFH